MQAYSNPERENDAHALPDVEIFYISQKEIAAGAWDDSIDDAGWYYWYCFPGCMPDSEPYGPYKSEEGALAAVREECST